MKIYLTLILFLIIFSFVVFSESTKESQVSQTDSLKKVIYQFTLNDIDGDPFRLNSLKGSVVLIVNVASKCGFTGQYKGLQRLYETYKDQGLIIIGVPSNDFSGQEPGTNSDIKNFCMVNYNVTFPMMSKISVKGKDQHPLYEFLTNKLIHPKTGGKISWNFNKFLVNRHGVVVKRYGSFTRPLSKRLIREVKKQISVVIE